MTFLLGRFFCVAIGGGDWLKARMFEDISYKKKVRLLNSGAGVNTFLPPLFILDDQATDLRNFTSTKYPAAKVRNGKTQIGSALTTVNGLGQRNNQYVHKVNAKAWTYWNGTTDVAVKTLSADATGTFEEFSTGTTKYTIFSNGTDREAWDGTGGGGMTSLTNAPTSKIFTTHKGRIFWARNNDIVYSALNLINDYTTAGDAGTIDITRIKGALISLITFSDRVWAFGEFSLHGLYGTGPTSFELIDIEGSVGNISDLGTVICNKMMYWPYWDGIYEFDGSTPVKVSEPYGNNGVKGGVTTFVQGIKASLKHLIAAGAIGDYMFMSIPYGSSATANNLTLVFDTKLREWFIRDEGFKNFVTVGNTLYGVDTAGKLWDMSATATTDGGTAISWYRITKAFNEGMASGLENVGEVWMRFKLPSGSTATLAYSTDMEGTSFTDLYTFSTSSSIQTVRVQLDVHDIYDAEQYRLKLYGTGDFELHQMEIYTRVQSNE
jgi:hypothetical protein